MHDYKEAMNGVSKVVTIGGVEFNGCRKKEMGTIGTIPSETFYNTLLAEFANLLEAGGEKLLDTAVNDDGKGLVRAINGMLEGIQPLGTVLPFAGSVVPNSAWMFCRGESISREVYAPLYAIIGNVYDVKSILGGASITQPHEFGLPDMGGRMPVGLTNFPPGSPFGNLNNKGGDETVALTKNQMPRHSHWIDRGTHVDDEGSRLRSGDGSTSSEQSQHTGGGAGAGDGDSDPHENMPPYIVMNYIMKVR